MNDAGPTLAGVIAAVAPGPAAIGVTVDLAPGAEPGRVVLLVSVPGRRVAEMASRLLTRL